MKQILISVLTVLCLWSCFQEQKTDIVGEWYTEQMNGRDSFVREELVLKEDGTYIWTRIIKDSGGQSVIDRDKGHYEVRIRYTHDSTAVPRIRFISENKNVIPVTISYVVENFTLTFIGEELNTLYFRTGKSGGKK
ncbi:MAG: hypothetical protein SOZ27_02460 [Spirochaetia bacterium]|nr:hypothetical protein [Spirochaetia bacterium]